MIRKQVLDTATEYVCKDRQATHGKPENTFANHAALWSVYLTGVTGVPIQLQPHQVAHMMVLFKVGRSMANPENLENYIDAAGYSACGAELAQNLEALEEMMEAKV